MRFGTVIVDGNTSAAVLSADGRHTLEARDLSTHLSTEGRLGVTVGLGGDPVCDAEAVLPLPRPAKVICCGLNYGEHIREIGRDRPTHPTLFAKSADSLVGPTDEIRLPVGLDVDWEAELAVVVGTTIRSVGRQAAEAALAGYTVANDVSVRDWQNRTLQWATVQGANTRTLVFDVADLLAYISTFTVLRPGDLVLTGTPEGVGAARDPQRFLDDGDVLETAIEGIGASAT